MEVIDFDSNWLGGQISWVQEKNREKLFRETRGFIHESSRGNNEQIIWSQAWKNKIIGLERRQDG